VFLEKEKNMRTDIFNMRYATVLGVAVGLFLSLPQALAQEKQSAREKPAQAGRAPAAVPEEQTTAANAPGNANATPQIPYLGVGVEPLHPAFWTHLRDVLENKQGVLVAAVSPGSPAEKAGIKPHDILLAFEQTKLYSPRELYDLVRSNKTGDKVTLHILREGKPQEISVTLGEHAQAALRHLGRRAMSYRNESFPEQGEMRWESFDSMTLTKVSRDRFELEISYLNKQGKMDHRSFAGTRQEILRDIRAQKDLPSEERGQLLRALDLRDEMRFEIPTAFYAPDGHMLLRF
jgi:hypothetical protein